MNYNKLRVFCMVARTLNFTKAADELYMSQPVLSRHISDLEADVKAPLFTRTNRNLVLTRAGEVLYRECEPFFAREQELYRLVREAAVQHVSELRVCFMGTVASYRLPEIQARFEKRAPGVSLAFERCNWNRVLRLVESGDADIGIKVCTVEQYPSGIERYVIREAHLSVIMPLGHPLAGLPEVPLEMLKHELFVMLDRDDSTISHDVTLQLFTEAGIEPRIVGHYPNVETALMMVQAGAGITVLSPLAPMKGMPGLVSVPIKNSLPLTLDLIWRKGAQNRAVEPFIESVKDLQW